MDTVDIVELAPDLHRVRLVGGGAHLLNVYLWLGPDGVTMIDTGAPGCADQIAAALTQLGRSTSDVERVVLTHAHDDHTGSAAVVASWSGAPVIAGKQDAAVIRGEARAPEPVLTEAERALRSSLGTPPEPAPRSRVDIEVVDGDILDFAGGAHVLEVPGHTPGSIALHLPSHRVLLTGDIAGELNGDVLLGPFNTDRAQARDSLRKLSAIDVDVLGFGHGEAITPARGRLATARDPLG